MNLYCFTLKQHVGNFCKPIVEIGSIVKRGQLIATPNGLGANIHSSVSGEVTNITQSEIIINANNEQSYDFTPIPKSKSYLTDIENAGIVGAGGAGFPTHVKLNVKFSANGCVIANAAECETLLAHNIQQTKEICPKIVQGIKYVMEITSATKGYIAIKSKHKTAISEISKAIENEPNIELVSLKDIYPMGDERMLIREILGVVLEPGKLPIEANVVVNNVETLIRITEAIEERKPFIDKSLTVSGRVNDESKVFLNVPIGTKVKTLIAKAGGYVNPHGEIVIGGPMTGYSGDEETPVTKTTGGILVSMPFPKETRKIGILACECGGSKERLTEIANNMGATVVASEMCKRMVDVNGRYRCDLPGVCPGQAEKVIAMKKQGAEVLLVGSCSD